MSSTQPGEGALSRGELLRRGLAVGGTLAAGPLVAGQARAATRVRTKSKTLVIGAFEDGALVPFKKKIIPLFKQQTGISIEFLTEPYDSFFAKAFNDGTAKAGQY